MTEPRTYGPGRRTVALLATSLLAFACSSDGHGGGSGAGGTSGSPATGGAGGAPPSAAGGSDGSSGGTSGNSGTAGSGGSAGTHGGTGGVARDAGAPGDGGPSAGGQGAGATDGGRSFSTDRTTFFGDSRCAAANVQFCESFESGDLSQWKLTGAPVVDGLQKARGQKALHIKVASAGKIAIETDKVFPEMKNTYYGRMFVYFAALPTPVGTTTYAHWTFIAATGDNVSGEIRVSGQMSNGINHFGVGTDNRTDANGTGDWTNSDNDPKGKPRAVPLNEWLCIEWMHKGDTNETRFYWDDSEHPSLYTSASTHGGNPTPYDLPTFRKVWLGFQEYQEVRNADNSLEQYELWIDEVALDRERIGCVL